MFARSPMPTPMLIRALPILNSPGNDALPAEGKRAGAEMVAGWPIAWSDRTGVADVSIRRTHRQPKELQAMTHTEPKAAPASQADLGLPVMECPAGRWWLCALLGVVLLAAGVLMFFNVVLASVISVIVFGATMVVAGGFQAVHAFSSQGWGGFFWSLIVGIVFILGGLLLMANPLAASFGLTLAFAAMLLVAGGVRLVLAYRYWQDYGWLLLASGILGILTAIVVLVGFPWSGLIVPGLLLAVDLVFHGLWWLTVGMWVRRPRAPSPARA
jgi:uncharacterized membrane protein HdeD (DUF308 family)